MPAVQLALRQGTYANALQKVIMEDQAFDNWHVQCVAAADPNQKGVIVVDCDGLGRLGSLLPHPERVVLICNKDPEQLCRAWNAGLVSVVYNDEPLATAMLAILAARFRALQSPD